MLALVLHPGGCGLSDLGVCEDYESRLRDPVAVQWKL